MQYAAQYHNKHPGPQRNTLMLTQLVFVDEYLVILHVRTRSKHLTLRFWLYYMYMKQTPYFKVLTRYWMRNIQCDRRTIEMMWTWSWQVCISVGQNRAKGNNANLLYRRYFSAQWAASDGFLRFLSFHYHYYYYFFFLSTPLSQFVPFNI